MNLWTCHLYGVISQTWQSAVIIAFYDSFSSIVNDDVKQT